MLEVVLVALGLEREAGQVRMYGCELLRMALRLQHAPPEEGDTSHWLLDLNQQVYEGGADLSESVIPSVLFLGWQEAEGLLESTEQVLRERCLGLGAERLALLVTHGLHVRRFCLQYPEVRLRIHVRCRHRKHLLYFLSL